MDTITQLSDRINCFLQLFILKLRSCSICRRHTAIIPSFWAVHTIRYFLTEFIRFHPIFSPLFRFFVRPSIRGNRPTFVNFQPRSGPTAGIWSVAFATKHFPSCILQESGDHLSSFFATERKRRPGSRFAEVIQQEFFQHSRRSSNAAEYSGFPCIPADPWI